MMFLFVVFLIYLFEFLFVFIDEMGIFCLIVVNMFGLNGVMVFWCLIFWYVFFLLNV